MSGGLEVLALKEEDVTKLLAASCHQGSTNEDYQMKQYIFRRKPDGESSASVVVGGGVVGCCWQLQTWPQEFNELQEHISVCSLLPSCIVVAKALSDPKPGLKLSSGMASACSELPLAV